MITIDLFLKSENFLKRYKGTIKYYTLSAGNI